MDKLKILKDEISCGEDSQKQFKADVNNTDSLASEICAFSNYKGGIIYIGVEDNGTIKGIDASQTGRINQIISNASSQHVKSPVSVFTENIKISDTGIVIKIVVPEGLDKPYFDRNGIIWIKCGSDKRKINSKEELKRIFQFSHQFHADELKTNAGINNICKLLYKDFLDKYFHIDYPETEEELKVILQNMNLATEDGYLTLAGALLFADKPELIKPQFIIKAVQFYGNCIIEDNYMDFQECAGPLSEMYKEAYKFVLRNLHRRPTGEGFNSPEALEIPERVIEELLVNALLHRDYLIDAPVRVFVFQNRIEIISPGCLPNNLTVSKILNGNSNIRNPVLVSFASKGLLPYKGIGSGIKRAVDLWPDIEFIDDRDSSIFKVIIHRK